MNSTIIPNTQSPFPILHAPISGFQVLCHIPLKKLFTYPEHSPEGTEINNKGLAFYWKGGLCNLEKELVLWIYLETSLSTLVLTLFTPSHSYSFLSLALVYLQTARTWCCNIKGCLTLLGLGVEATGDRGSSYPNDSPSAYRKHSLTTK